MILVRRQLQIEMRLISKAATLFFVLNLALEAMVGGSTIQRHRGKCPSMDVQQNFEAESYMGLWYEQAHYNVQQYEGDDAECVTAHYTLNTTTSVVNVTNVAINGQTGGKISIEGTAVLDDPSKDEGKLTVTFNIAGFEVEGMYWVLGTDYDNYSVVYACTNQNHYHNYTIWYLGRTQTFHTKADRKSYFKTTNKVLRKHGLKPSIMKRTQQTNCGA